MSKKRKRSDEALDRPPRGRRLPIPFPVGWEEQFSPDRQHASHGRQREANRNRTNRNLELSGTVTEEQPADVTQAELRALEEGREVSTQTNKLRDDIRERLLAGATVEPGPVIPSLGVRELKIFSFARLSEIIGEEDAEDLRRRIAPTVHVHLLLKKRNGLEAD